MKQKISLFLLSLLGIIGIISFQNCGNIRFQSIVVPSQTFKVQSTTEFCAPASLDVKLPQKIVIINDMSASNVSKFSEQAQGVIPIRWWVGQFAFEQSVRANAPVPRPTDIYGDRIKALQSYLNTCDLNSENKYAVIGFSDAIIRPAGSTGSSCESGLVDKNNALLQLASLRRVQLDTLCMAYGSNTPPTNFLQTYQSHYGMNCGVNQAKEFQTTPGDPFVMKGTSYKAAFNCMESRIMNSLDLGELNKDYKVLFVTDGKPSDTVPGGSMPNSTYVNQLIGIRNSLQSSGYSLTFQPIYYGGQDEFPEASQRLDEMARNVRTTASDGTEIKTVRIQPDGQIDSSMRAALCNSPVESIPVSFESERVQMFSLNSHQMGSVIVSDKDMDGLRDDLEPTITSISLSPDKSRTRIVLDSLCYLNPLACDAFIASAPVCDPSLKVGFGFSQCDALFINQKIIDVDQNPSAKSFDGMDYDGDNILDFIELVKGTNMFVRDAVNNGDNLTTEYKLLHNLDPLSFTDEATNQLYNNNFSFQEISTCSSGIGMNVVASNLQFVETQEAVDEKQILPNHSADENVFVIFYFARPSIVNTQKISIFGKYLFIKKSGETRYSDLFSVGTIDRSSP